MRPPALSAVFVLVLGGASTAASPVITTAYGIEFITVGDAGNPAVRADEFIFTERNPSPTLGVVDYEYRIARTEVTAAQWLEFALAYEPFYRPNGQLPTDQELDALGGSDVRFRSFNGWFINQNPDRAAGVRWVFAARYANWLHNDKANEAWAFETGAYDTSTFGFDEDGVATHAPTALPGARFRLPTESEWLKAAHYDPDRYGPGEGGFWAYQHGSNGVPVWGPPGAGETDLLEPSGTISVGSYPNAPSPWGALDMGGTRSNWTETIADFGPLTDAARRAIYGPSQAGALWQSIDFMGSSGGVDTFQTIGLRLVAPIPSVPVLSIALVAATLPRRVRR